MTNSRSKGARGEREGRDQLRDAGFEARRGQQHAGGPDSPDVVCPDLPGIHFEVKRVENLNLHKAMGQAIRDAADCIPVVAHRRNRGDWMVTMRAQDWFSLLRETDQPR
jgi:Holliday junction resolvase